MSLPSSSSQPRLWRNSRGPNGIGVFGRTGIRAWTSGDRSASQAAGLAFRF